jgi:hypothetical protein
VSATDVRLASEALALLGAQPITAFDDGTDVARICALTYGRTRDALLAGDPWRFTLRKARLARLSVAPIGEWPYAHQLPAELLTLRALFASAGSTAPLLDYERFEGQVLSRHLDLWADYQVQIPESAWPPVFAQGFVQQLAANLAMPVTDRANVAEYWEAKAGRTLARARVVDAQQQPPQEITDWSLIAVRGGG